MTRKMIRAIQRLLRNKGISVAKYPAPSFARIDIQAIFLNQLWIHELGNKLKFVQVGANNGFSGGDPISHLYLQNKWQGILIEPQPDVFMELKDAFGGHNNLTLVNKGISNHSGTLKIYRNPKEKTTASFKKSIVSKQNPNSAIEELAIDCIPLSALLSSFNWTDIDILIIDTEGHEKSVLESIDFARHRPKFIQFEHGHLNRKELDACFRLLTKEKYALHFGGQQNQDSFAISLI